MMNLDNEEKCVHKNTVIATCESGDVADIKSIDSSQTKLFVDVVPGHLREVHIRATVNTNEEQDNKFQNILQKNKKKQESFSKNLDDIGRTHLVEHKIDTGSSKPI